MQNPKSQIGNPNFFVAGCEFIRGCVRGYGGKRVSSRRLSCQAICRVCSTILGFTPRCSSPSAILSSKSRRLSGGRKTGREDKAGQQSGSYVWMAGSQKRCRLVDKGHLPCMIKDQPFAMSPPHRFQTRERDADRAGMSDRWSNGTRDNPCRL